MEPMHLKTCKKKQEDCSRNCLVENGYTVKRRRKLWDLKNQRQPTNGFQVDHYPSLDNFAILSRLLHTSIEDIPPP